MDEEKNRLASVGRLCDIVARLRGPGGCPWDGAQTHESLKPEVIEGNMKALEMAYDTVAGPARRMAAGE